MWHLQHRPFCVIQTGFKDERTSNYLCDCSPELCYLPVSPRVSRDWRRNQYTVNEELKLATSVPDCLGP